MSETKNVTIICPFLNEEENLNNFYNQLRKTLANINANIKYQIAFINDGSTDNSANIINNIKKNDETINLINFTKNFGHQKAILAGLENFNSDYYITLDTDLQMPTELIIDMVKKIQLNNNQIVHCICTNANYEGKMKKTLSMLFYKFFCFFSESNMPKNASDYWIITKKIRDLIINDKIAHNFIRSFIYSTGYEVSKIEFIKQIKPGLNLYSFEYKPKFKNHPLGGHARYIGYMAHEVEKLYPNAVQVQPNGYKSVNYSLIGI
jgi:dolichol-phosphate mannosyltransferase